MPHSKKQTLITLNDLPQRIHSLPSEKILLLTDPVVYEVNTLSEHFAPFFEKGTAKRINVSCKLLTVDSLEQTYKECADFYPDMIIMVGGGTVLDTGKMINLLLAYACKPVDLTQFKSEDKKLIPMVAIPTTSGTGSEATHFAVLYKDTIKYSVADNNLIPDYAILAPELTLSMPKKLAAYTGFDAFAQAIESYWSINSTDESKEYSKEALSLIRSHFVDSVLQNSLASRTAMQKAANLAGKAINIAQTTAPHSVSYPMSSFFGIPHGLAAYLILPSIFAFNNNITGADCADPRGVAYVRKTMGELSKMICDNDKTAYETLCSYFNTFSIDSRLSSYGISNNQDINYILDNGFNPQRMKNNPRGITREDLSAILQEIV